MNKKEVCDLIFEKLMEELPENWDGKKSILYMKDCGCRNWRQMEWPGWYFQFMCEEILSQSKFMKIPGPKYGNVEFDGFKELPWDFKVHANNAGSKVPTNGLEEVMKALDEYEAVGFIIACGNVIYDDENETFKKWHDNLKGKISDYEKERIQRGAKSRARKKVFELKTIEFVFIDKNTISRCGSFQAGMRNSDGTPRNPKVMVDIADKCLEKYVYKV